MVAWTDLDITDLLLEIERNGARLPHHRPALALVDKSPLEVAVSIGQWWASAQRHRFRVEAFHRSSHDPELSRLLMESLVDAVAQRTATS